jgi:hypothetical protein
MEINRGFIIGNGPYVKALVLASAQAALERGATLTGGEGITLKNSTATAVNLAKFAAFIARMAAILIPVGIQATKKPTCAQVG